MAVARIIQTPVSVSGVVHTHPGEREPILRGVSLDVGRGEMVGITGPSGGGKTTLLNLIAGLVTPGRGEIAVQGRSMRAMTANARALWRGKVIGYAYQDTRLLPQLDVATNVAWPLLFGPLSRGQALRQAQALLERLHLAPLARHRPTTLSGGEQRRVALARALAARPPVLLVDEPTSNLDPEAAVEVMDLLTQVQRELETTTLLVSHDGEALARCGRTVEIRGGTLAERAH